MSTKHDFKGLMKERHSARRFQSKEITEELKSRYPKIKDENGVEESDESYICRLCHIIMHHNHPRMLQMIKCEECIQAWMNSDKW